MCVMRVSLPKRKMCVTHFSSTTTLSLTQKKGELLQPMKILLSVDSILLSTTASCPSRLGYSGSYYHRRLRDAEEMSVTERQC